ncbi:MAG: hypothetical protein LIO93_06405 [Bacteroidales bacterium]|nr:hypothetical protein [Bacteroidales bacterium]
MYVLIIISLLFTFCMTGKNKPHIKKSANPFLIQFKIENNENVCFGDTIIISVQYFNTTDSTLSLSIADLFLIHDYEGKFIFVDKPERIFLRLENSTENPVELMPSEAYKSFHPVFISQEFFYPDKNNLALLVHFIQYNAKSSNTQILCTNECNNKE